MVSRLNINLIILLISISLLGLTIIQFNWINQAIALQENRFNDTVFRTLQNIVNMYETIESKNKFQKSENIQRLLNTIDEARDKSGLAKPTTLKRDIKLIDDKEAGLQYISDQNSCIDPQSYVSNKEMEQLLSLIDKGGDVLQILAKDMLLSEQTIEQRIDRASLDSIVTRQLKNSGIETEFNYVVKIPKTNRLIALNKDVNVSQLIATPYKVNLFSNTPKSKNAELMLFFPNQKNYLLGKIWMMLSSSLVFIFVTLIGFAISILTIFKQKQLSEMKTDFINNMTHELKTPISTISLASEMIRAQLSGTENKSLLKYSNIIFDENKRLGSQVDRVLQMAVIDRGEMKLKLTFLDIHQIINEAAQKFLIKIEERDGKFETKLKAENFELEGDKVHITNIIHNLLDNAYKYSKESPAIIVSTRNKNKHLEISVKDNGIGMTRDAVQRIFDKFYRVHTGNVHDVKGFGLGLSYVKKIVDAHHGEIKVNSEPNNGSEFILRFPQNN